MQLALSKIKGMYRFYNGQKAGPYSLSGVSTLHPISQNIETTTLDVDIVVSLWYLTTCQISVEF